MNQPAKHITKLAVPVPRRESYDYISEQKITAGTRVVAPFGNRQITGIVLAQSKTSIHHSLKSLTTIIDHHSPTLDTQVFNLALWAAEYYHHPVGDVMQNCLPSFLRNANPIENPLQTMQIDLIPQNNPTSIDAPLLNRAPKQQALFNYIQQHAPIDISEIDSIAEKLDIRGVRQLILSLQKKQLIEKKIITKAISKENITPEPLPDLTEDQKNCVESILSHQHHYHSFVLQGITGSGKTEVYMSITANNMINQKQTLVLIPEISLTPQLVKRFKQRFGNTVYSYHSSMSDKQRYQTWWLCRTGQASIVLGTRSAIFLGFKNLATIIVDEEHDLSFKQLEGFRYHARDLALKRANMADIPIILGSATPGVETIYNISTGKYSRLLLNQRIGKGGLPDIQLVDMQSQPQQHSISLILQQAIKAALDKKQQVILYVNRRGYAPIAQCYGCGWQARCTRCDAYMTFHSRIEKLCCHHCGKQQKNRQQCPNCKDNLYFGGAGTQRIQTATAELFPGSRIIRFDRDAITTQNKLEQAIKNINSQKYDIIIGTQLVVKGHDFSNVTLVGVIDADQGMFSTDFRAPEYLLQQLIQVSGRAGRGNQPGRVIIQTHHIANPFYQYIRNHDFDNFQKQCHIERTHAGLPPYGHLALWRAESVKPMTAIHFLNNVKKTGECLLGNPSDTTVQIMDSVPSPMEKRAGRFRAQLLVKSTQRKPLHQLLGRWIAVIEKNKKNHHVRWSIDIDPKDMN